MEAIKIDSSDEKMWLTMKLNEILPTKGEEWL